MNHRPLFHFSADVPMPSMYTTTTTGTSMLPVIHTGDSFYVIQVPIEYISVGNFIVWRDSHDGINVLHKVINKGRFANGEWYLVTKGINNTQRDGPLITSANLRGVVVGVKNAGTQRALPAQ